VKSIENSKTRLSEILKPKERSLLTRTMFMDVISIVQQTQIFSYIVVISSDREVLKLAKKENLFYVEEHLQGLNQAVNQVTEWCKNNGAASLLILPSDIPLLTRNDLVQITSNIEAQQIIIAPSGNGGTNALLRTPPDIMNSFFGKDSFQRHLINAEKTGLKIQIYQSPTVSLDIDTVEDIKRFNEIKGNTLTHSLLEKFDIIKRISDSNF
jgi:2-phospho-L-lactate guanylyltransferase